MESLYPADGAGNLIGLEARLVILLCVFMPAIITCCSHYNSVVDIISVLENPLL